MPKQKILIIVTVLVLITAIGYGLNRYLPNLLNGRNTPTPSSASNSNQSLSATPVSEIGAPSVSETPTPSIVQQFRAPIERALERVTKKPFGIYITPQNSPVQPERFSGYHTGVDFETFVDEQDKDVSVYAICTGVTLLKEWASGYGGLVVQSCQLANQDITVIYGHLNLASVGTAKNLLMSAGEKIGNLGKGFSQETDGERKHLHLGIHKGRSINILGYVQNSSELSNWMDINLYLK